MQALEPIPVNAITTAFEWHGGGGSPFYSFASTRTVHSEAHRAELYREIAVCEAAARKYEQPEELSALDNLKRVVEVAYVGEPLMTFEEYREQTE